MYTFSLVHCFYFHLITQNKELNSSKNQQSSFGFFFFTNFTVFYLNFAIFAVVPSVFIIHLDIYSHFVNAND